MSKKLGKDRIFQYRGDTMNSWMLEDVRLAITILETYMWDRRHQIPIEDGLHQSLRLAIETLRDRESLLCKVNQIKEGQNNDN